MIFGRCESRAPTTRSNSRPPGATRSPLPPRLYALLPPLPYSPHRTPSRHQGLIDLAQELGVEHLRPFEFELQELAQALHIAAEPRRVCNGPVDALRGFDQRGVQLQILRDDLCGLLRVLRAPLRCRLKSANIGHQLGRIALRVGWRGVVKDPFEEVLLSGRDDVDVTRS